MVLAPFLNMLRDIEPKTLLLKDKIGNTPAHDAVISGEFQKLEILTQVGQTYCQEKIILGRPRMTSLNIQ